jgi:hypothetical protein
MFRLAYFPSQSLRQPILRHTTYRLAGTTTNINTLSLRFVRTSRYLSTTVPATSSITRFHSYQHTRDCAHCQTTRQLALHRFASQPRTIRPFSSKSVALDTMCRMSPVDPNSYANVHQIQTRHVHLDLNVDFARRVLTGRVRLSLQTIADDVTNVVLDTNALNIKQVKLANTDDVLKASIALL